MKSIVSAAYKAEKKQRELIYMQGNLCCQEKGRTHWHIFGAALNILTGSKNYLPATSAKFTVFLEKLIHNKKISVWNRM